MTYKEERNDIQLKNLAIIEISDLDMVGLKLMSKDRLFFKTCSKTNKISEKLKGLLKIAVLLEKEEEKINARKK